MEHRAVKIIPLVLREDIIPVARVQIQIPAGVHQTVHGRQRPQNILVGYIGQGVARAHHTVIFSRRGLVYFAEIGTEQLDRKALLLRLFPALGQHGLIQIGACDLIPQLRQLQRQIPAADGTIQHRFNARTGKDGLIMLPEDIPPALVEAQVVDISTVI